MNSHGQRIEFRDVDLSTDGWIRCAVVREDSEDFWVKLPYSYRPAPDLVAAFFVSLCGTRFEEISIDLPLGHRLIKHFEECAEAKLEARPGQDRDRRPGSSTSLNFSGGFDSLAAWAMLPEASLVSLDFGGRFSREREFFHRFDPLTFSTNLVDLGLNRYSWEFMGMGSVLLRDELSLSIYSFGSVLAGSLPHVLKGPLDQRGTGVRAYAPFGLQSRNPVTGVTEIGTLSMVMRESLSLVPEVLDSVALPKEEKFTRKIQMIEAVSVTHGLPRVTGSHQVANRARRPWGSSFATDLSSLYVMRAVGVDAIAETYLGGVPTEVTNEIETLNLDFLTRFNPHAYAGVEPSTLAKWYSRLLEYGVLPYQRQDWASADSVVSLLKRTQPER